MQHLLLFVCLAFVFCGCRAGTALEDHGHDRPNVVIIFTDDQGYGDLGCYGSPSIRTPRLDELAAGGMKLTHFHVAAPVCSPSRAALLTGCYPKRVGMHRHVVFPGDAHGLHQDELTLADLLRREGYATGCFGKWHLGHRPGLLPNDQGFEEYFGVPYSNDMAQFHRASGSSYGFRLPMMRDAEVVEWEPDQRYLTQRFTDAAVDFIARHADERFFVYLAHSMPHIPLYASDAFARTSPRGLYGDVIEELDDSVGRIVDALAELGLTRDTLIIFASDNGPWLTQKERGGSAGPLRDGKGTVFEGGLRVPCIVHWPAEVPPASVCTLPTTAMDLLPTVAAWVGADLSGERPIDGHDIRDLLRGKPGASSPNECFLYYGANGQLGAFRRGPWKLHLASRAIYQLEEDPGECWNRAETREDLVSELAQIALQMDEALQSASRPSGHVDTMAFDPRR